MKSLFYLIVFSVLFFFACKESRNNAIIQKHLQFEYNSLENEKNYLIIELHRIAEDDPKRVKVFLELALNIDSQFNQFINDSKLIVKDRNSIKKMLLKINDSLRKNNNIVESYSLIDSFKGKDRLLDDLFIRNNLALIRNKFINDLYNDATSIYNKRKAVGLYILITYDDTSYLKYNLDDSWIYIEDEYPIFNSKIIIDRIIVNGKNEFVKYSVLYDNKIPELKLQITTVRNLRIIK